MFECATCGYQTKRKWSFDYHNSRKTPCKPKVNTENVNKNVKEFENVKQNTDIINKFVNINVNESGKGNIQSTGIDYKSKQCLKCNKCFPTNQNLNRHSKICTGVDALTCPICLKTFRTRSAKSRHKSKKVQCVPHVGTVEIENDPKICKRLMEDIKLKDTENDLIKKQNEMLSKVIENNRLKNINEALKKKIETLENKPKQKRSFVNQVNRYQIAASQKWCCRICTELLPGVFHIDHTIPLKFGGDDNLENVTAVCIQCHALKTHEELDAVTV